MDMNRNTAFFDKLKQNVAGSFDRLRKAVDMREKLLLRQLTVVVQQAQHIVFEFDSIRFKGDGEDELVSRIRTFGRYNIDNFNVILQKEPYENVDYILPSNDHDLMHKSCRQGADDERDPESEEIVVEFFNNRSLIKDSAEMLRESIINLTLNESREIIERTIACREDGFPRTVVVERSDTAVMEPPCKIDPTTLRVSRGRCSISDIPLDSLSNDDGSNNNLGCVADGNSKSTRNLSRDGGEKIVSLSIPAHRMIPKASQTDGLIMTSHNAETCKATPDKRVKNVGHHLAMGSCGSTINLKNVTNLTINACPERVAPTSAKQIDPSSVEAGGDSGGRNCPSEQGSPECGFYKRLITENKLLRNHVLKSMLGGEGSNSPVNPPKTASDLTESTTSKGTVTETNLPSNGTDGPPSSIGSAPAQEEVEENDPYLKFSLSDKELQHMLDMPTSLQNKSLSFVLGELYGLANGANASGTGLPNAAGDDTKEHTNQIQQWLKQIISESETEPFQNAEMLEFSKINN